MKESLLTENEINELIVNYLTNSISETDLKKLTLWINISNDNRQYFNSLKDAWIVSENSGKSIRTPEKSWSLFKTMLEHSDDPGKRNKKLLVLRYLRIAAIWIVLMGVGSLITYLIIKNPDDFSAMPVSVHVPLGAKSNIILPDGSNVWLNAGTTLTYDKEYGLQERKLQLTGEAFFDVAKDEYRPFIVEVSGIVVRALGTKFNVKAYPEENTVSATLEEGKIDVELSNSAGELQSIILSPKEKIVFTKDTRESSIDTINPDEMTEKVTVTGLPISNKIKSARIISNVKTELYTSWKEKRWVIYGEPLGTLTPILERRFNLNIIYGNNELKEYKFSGTIENETVEQILNAMKLTAPLDYIIDKDTVRLFVDNNLKKNFQKIMRNNN